MNPPKLTILLMAVAGIAMLCSGCGSIDYRTGWAQTRCQQVMAQARMDAVGQLLAAGHVEHAQKVLAQYLPEADSAPLLMLAAEDEDDKEEAPSQYAKVTLESDLEPEAQAW